MADLRVSPTTTRHPAPACPDHAAKRKKGESGIWGKAGISALLCSGTGGGTVRDKGRMCWLGSGGGVAEGGRGGGGDKCKC